MDPVLIFRHSPTEGPGYFSSFLDRHGIPWALVRSDAGDSVPTDLNGVSGLCLMGGPMSVNDDLPWIDAELELIRGAVALGRPVVGHCLGGQLISKALGGSVGPAPVKEIGWGDLHVTDAEAARPWIGEAREPLPGFHWHGETFTLPAGARRILASAYCAQQAFVFDDRHLAMQCHVEMTPDLVRQWCLHGADEIAASPGPAVQRAEDIQADLEARIARLHALADKIYSRWIQGLSRR